MATAAATRSDDLSAYEAGFRRAGLPLFVADRSAARDVFNRSVPLLGVVFLGEMLGALNLEWSTLANVGAVAAGLALLLAGIAAVNRSRGRPPVGIPEDVGRAELAAFVLVPALLPLIFGGQWLSALVTATANLALLGVVYAVLGLGVFSIVRWALRRLLGQLAASLELFARAVPLLMLFAVVLFFTTEMWQVFTGIPTVNTAILATLFVALGSSFLVARLPREVRAIERETGGESPELDRGERFNVGLVMFVSQGLQVLAVSVAIGGFFVAMGMLTIDEGVMLTWIGEGGEVLVSVDLFDHEAILTVELLEVAGAIAALTGLYFAISMLTDDVYRREFLEELTAEMSESFRERAAYLRLRAGPGR